MWVLSGLLTWDRARRLRPVALQSSDASHLLADVQPAERMASWHLISPAGARDSGGAAITHVLRLLPGGRMPAMAFARFPKFTEKAYRWVAEHRSQLSRLIPTRAKRNASRGVQEHIGDAGVPIGDFVRARRRDAVANFAVPVEAEMRADYPEPGSSRDGPVLRATVWPHPSFAGSRISLIPPTWRNKWRDKRRDNRAGQS